MKNLSQKTQPVLSALFFLLSFLVLYFMYGQIRTTQEASDQKFVEWRIEAARRDEIKSLNSLMQKIADKQILIETHFAQSSNPVPFLDTLEKLASSVHAKNLVSSVEVSGDGKSLVVGLSVSGSFEAFYKFLTLLENSQYELEFLSVDVKKDGLAGDWSAILKIKLLTFIK